MPFYFGSWVLDLERMEGKERESYCMFTLKVEMRHEVEVKPMFELNLWLKVIKKRTILDPEEMKKIFFYFTSVHLGSKLWTQVRSVWEFRVNFTAAAGHKNKDTSFSSKSFAGNIWMKFSRDGKKQTRPPRRSTARR